MTIALNKAGKRDVAEARQAGGQLDLEAVNKELEGADAMAITRWAAGAFPTGLVMTSSFGVQAAVMLHLVTRVVPGIPVVFVDTGYLHPETYRFVEDMTKQLGLNLKVYQSAISPARMEALYGKLWEQDEEGLNRYDRIRKVEPMQEALGELGATAWLAGLRGEQTEHRAGLRVVELQDGRYKVHPILRWSTKEVHAYLGEHGLPYHPLREQGYASVGDWHSTRPITAGEDDRAGRFRGLKQECGLHLPETAEENQSRESSDL